MRIWALLIAGFLIAGCANKKVTKIREKEQAIANTKKSEIFIDDKRILVLATYLNDLEDVEAIDKSTENFVISFYVGTKKLSTDFIKDILVNTKSATYRVLNPQDELLNSLAINNSWSKYILVKAPKKNDLVLTLSVETYQSGTVKLNFEKEFQD